MVRRVVVGWGGQEVQARERDRDKDRERERETSVSLFPSVPRQMPRKPCYFTALFFLSCRLFTLFSSHLPQVPRWEVGERGAAGPRLGHGLWRRRPLAQRRVPPVAVRGGAGQVLRSGPLALGTGRGQDPLHVPQPPRAAPHGACKICNAQSFSMPAEAYSALCQGSCSYYLFVDDRALLPLVNGLLPGFPGRPVESCPVVSARERRRAVGFTSWTSTTRSRCATFSTATPSHPFSPSTTSPSSLFRPPRSSTDRCLCLPRYLFSN